MPGGTGEAGALRGHRAGAARHAPDLAQPLRAVPSSQPRISTPAHFSITRAIEVELDFGPNLALVIARISRTAAPSTLDLDCPELRCQAMACPLERLTMSRHLHGADRDGLA